MSVTQKLSFVIVIVKKETKTRLSKIGNLILLIIGGLKRFVSVLKLCFCYKYLTKDTM